MWEASDEQAFRVGPESPALARLGRFLSVTCQYRIAVTVARFVGVSLCR